MSVVTPADRPKSANNRCVIEGFGGDFFLSRCFLDLSVCVGAFVIGPSRFSSFFSQQHEISTIFRTCSRHFTVQDIDPYYLAVFD